MPPSAHTHPESDVTGLVSDLAAKEAIANKNTGGGYAGLDGSGQVPGTRIIYGGTANTAAQGNDSRLSDARVPTAHAATHQIYGSDALEFDADLTPAGNVTILPGYCHIVSGTFELASGFTLDIGLDGVLEIL
jgi:hypothetical protein